MMRRRLGRFLHRQLARYGRYHLGETAAEQRRNVVWLNRLLTDIHDTAGEASSTSRR